MCGFGSQFFSGRRHYGQFDRQIGPEAQIDPTPGALTLVRGNRLIMLLLGLPLVRCFAPMSCLASRAVPVVTARTVPVKLAHAFDIIALVALIFLHEDESLTQELMPSRVSFNHFRLSRFRTSSAGTGYSYAAKRLWRSNLRTKCRGITARQKNPSRNHS